MSNLVTNKSYWQYYKSLHFNEKCLMILYFFALVPCSIPLLMGINTRIGISAINPVLEIVIFIALIVLSFRVFVHELKWWDLPDEKIKQIPYNAPIQESIRVMRELRNDEN